MEIAYSQAGGLTFCCRWNGWCLSYKGQTLLIVSPDSRWGFFFFKATSLQRLKRLVAFQPKPVNNARDVATVAEGQQTAWPRLEDIYQQKQWGY